VSGGGREEGKLRGKVGGREEGKERVGEKRK
jgi:hypothetical protein